MLAAFGGEPLCAAIAMCAAAGTGAQSQLIMAAAAAGLRSEGGKQLQCFADGLRLLVGGAGRAGRGGPGAPRGAVGAGRCFPRCLHSASGMG